MQCRLGGGFRSRDGRRCPSAKGERKVSGQGRILGEEQHHHGVQGQDHRVLLRRLPRQVCCQSRCLRIPDSRAEARIQAAPGSPEDGQPPVCHRQPGHQRAVLGSGQEGHHRRLLFEQLPRQVPPESSAVPVEDPGPERARKVARGRRRRPQHDGPEELEGPLPSEEARQGLLLRRLQARARTGRHPQRHLQALREGARQDRLLRPAAVDHLPRGLPSEQDQQQAVPLLRKAP